MTEPLPLETTPQSIYETMAIRNVIANGSLYDCEIEHPKYGWIPFTASADDPEVEARTIYERIVAEL